MARPAQTDVSRTLDIIVVAMDVIVDESSDESSALWSTLPLLMSALTSSRILNSARDAPIPNRLHANRGKRSSTFYSRSRSSHESCAMMRS